MQRIWFTQKDEVSNREKPTADAIPGTELLNDTAANFSLSHAICTCLNNIVLLLFFGMNTTE